MRRRFGLVPLALAAAVSAAPAAACDDTEMVTKALAASLLSGASPTIKASGIDAAALDFRLDSLKAVDAYLAKRRDALPGPAGAKDVAGLGEEELRDLVLEFGAYAGEVIRQNAGGKLHWCTWPAAIADRPAAGGELGPTPTISTMFVLVSASGETYTMPLGKVLNYLETGSGDGTYAFAKGLVAGK